MSDSAETPHAGGAVPEQLAEDLALPAPVGAHLCLWCQQIPVGPGGRYCSRKCRQAAFRLRKKKRCWGPNPQPGVFDYADPPYVGKAWRYAGEPDHGGEVDHAELVSRLVTSFRSGETLGFALSFGGTWASLKAIVTLIPDDLAPRVCPWVKPHGVSQNARGPYNVWEGVVVVGGRALPPGVPDALVAMPARGGGKLPGRKPLAFAAWLSDLLGMLPGDELRDLFPGSGAVGRAWRELSPRTAAVLPPDQRELVRQRILPTVATRTGRARAQAARAQLSLLGEP